MNERVEGVPDLSIVIPAYNEALRLPAYLEEIGRFFQKRGQQDHVEIIVVDDGSHDGTNSVVERFRQRNAAVKLFRHTPNRGKGYAVRVGMRQARGRLCLFADSDGATPISEIAKLEERIAQGAEVAIGSRALPDPSCVLRVRLHRKFFGRIFHQLICRLGIRGLTDTQCGFKLFQAGVAKELFSLLQIDGYGFDVELLFVAQKRGYRVVEVAVNWADQPGSKVRVLHDGLRMLREVWRVRRNDRQGLYALRNDLLSVTKPVEKGSSIN
jgi:dolichyl-phosphate beta-glucosyltransferase